MIHSVGQNNDFKDELKTITTIHFKHIKWSLIRPPRFELLFQKLFLFKIKQIHL